MTSIKDFMISRVRTRIMELFFSRPEDIFYVREIARTVKEETNAVRRELERMVEYGMLKREERGNRLYYLVNKKYLFYPELQQMVAKSSGLGKRILQLRSKLGTLDFVMFSGKFIRRVRPHQDEVDILIIGDVVLPELQALIKEEEAKLGREINYAVFSAAEFEFRKQRRDPFVMDILYQTRVMIAGEDFEFAERQPAIA